MSPADKEHLNWVAELDVRIKDKIPLWELGQEMKNCARKNEDSTAIKAEISKTLNVCDLRSDLNQEYWKIIENMEKEVQEERNQ